MKTRTTTIDVPIFMTDEQVTRLCLQHSYKIIHDKAVRLATRDLICAHSNEYQELVDKMHSQVMEQFDM